MEFREGMLGVVVVALALTGALFASYFAGIDSEQVEYTDYDYLADISGLFTYDQSPTYIDFDPSTNYTGYYSEDTGEYWPEELVDYVPNVNKDTHTARPNNYKINLAPEEDSTSVVDISVLTEQDIPGMSDGLSSIGYWTQNYNPQQEGLYTIVAKTTTLSQLISQFDYGDYDRIRIASIEGTNAVVSGGTVENPLEVGWTIFFPQSWVSDHGSQLWRYTLNVAQKDVYESFEWPSYVSSDNKMAKLALSCEINMRTGLVTLYYDNAFENSIGSFALDTMSMAYSQGSTPQISPKTVLSDTATITVQQFPPAEYLDPNYGVAMKE